MAALDSDSALQFAIMLQAGVPSKVAILYFVDEAADPVEVARMEQRWMNSRAVKTALSTLMKKSWQQMSIDERCRYALDQHYSQLAFVLHSNHYGEVNPADKAKLDTARQAIEAKLAGMAGKQDALSQFLIDVKEGKLKVAKPVPVGLTTS